MRLSIDTPLVQTAVPAGTVRQREPITPEPNTRAAFIAYAASLLPQSDFFATVYDGALEVAERYIGAGMVPEHRYATKAEIAAVLPTAEARDDAQYGAADGTNASAENATTFIADAPPITVHFLAVLAAQAKGSYAPASPAPVPTPQPSVPTSPATQFDAREVQQLVSVLRGATRQIETTLDQLVRVLG